jgi:phosphohistidine swiveling domain-containing protein
VPGICWRRLSDLDDPALAKLHNLRRARSAGFLIPEPTIWAYAADLEGSVAETSAIPRLVGLPCIVRSVSPTEDTPERSRAGKFVSIVVWHENALADALGRVAASLPASKGRRLGAVAVQPLLLKPRAGVTFFDGFYYEESALTGYNGALTSGWQRGQVSRGHVVRGEPRSHWLVRLHQLIGSAIDVEWTETADGSRILLQVRPALFPVRRCETLSLANHQETLGDLPSPWIAGVYADLGNPVLDLARRADPALPEWNEPYAIILTGRIWVNFSSLFRLMDRWGLPRSLISRTLGGACSDSGDGRFLPWAFLRSFPSLVRMGWICLMSERTLGRDLLHLDGALDSARSLMDLWNVNVLATQLLIRGNFALLAAASTSSAVRRLFGLGSQASPVTRSMMEEYSEVAARPGLADRLQGLEDWLSRHGHRGPCETDPAQRRFNEMSDILRRDLARTNGLASAPAGGSGLRRSLPLTRLLCRWEERREWFRDEHMKRTQRLRQRIVEEAARAVASGALARPEDVFFLDRHDLAADPGSWKARATRNRTRWQHAASVDLPTTATRDAIERAQRHSASVELRTRCGHFQGIGLGSRMVMGRVVRAGSIEELLNRESWPEPAVLVVEAVEPSWSVVYPRFRAVVSELGGELSHGAILLREAAIPCVINASGAFRGLVEGDLVRVDPTRGEVWVERSERTTAVNSDDGTLLPSQ